VNKDLYIVACVVGCNKSSRWTTLFVKVPLMDVAGRRILLLVPMLIMIIDLAVLTACLLTQVRSLLSI